MSIYNKINVDELIWSIKGLKKQSIQPDEIIIVLDGYCRINLVYNLKKYLVHSLVDLNLCLLRKI